MDRRIDFDQVPGSTPRAAGYDSPSAESWGAGEAEDYGEIAERRAQLECAETLRRVRAL
jgi:hypothetical protein